MRTPEAPLSTQRLGEFLVFLSSIEDEATAIQVAVERTAIAFEAEVAVVLGVEGAMGAVGFAEGRVPTAVLVEAIVSQRAVLRVPGAGLCHLAVAPLNRRGQGHLLVARSGLDGFDAEEIGLLRGMARVLELTLEKIRKTAAERRLVDSLQQRQLLLEQVSDIQRKIAKRVPHDEILSSITMGAHRLLGDDVIALWMRDPDDPASLLLVSSRGWDADTARRLWRLPAAEAGVAGAALTQNSLVVATPASLVTTALASEFGGIVAAMAAPVHEMGEVVGSLEVASRTRGRAYSDGDQRLLTMFAEQVSLAVTDSKTHQAMREAFHDSLTGLASRKLFIDSLDHALAAARRERTRVAVLFIDLDSFKIVNDSLGHAAGDALLIGVAHRIRRCIRDGDIAARLGGDEFAVILPGLLTEDPAIRVAERIIESVRAPFRIEGKEAFVDVSVGVAMDTGVAKGQGLLDDADLAMYQAKREGKGRCEVFRPALREAFTRRLDLQGDLRHAIERDQLVLHYQPIFDLRSGDVTGVEALMRWKHPTRGLLPPAEFIPLAEETGLIIPLEMWALGTACEQVSGWNDHRAPADSLTLNVNLSVRQVQRPDLAELVRQTLIATRLPPERLVLEITESLFLQGTDVIVERLRQLERLRVRLAVDDFGTGYSSLSYLARLPIHIMKIDKTFVDGMSTGPLAKAIIQLGHTLGLTTLAEGIEAKDQLEGLRSAGCQFGQGFYFSKPLTAEEIEPLVLGSGDPRASGRTGDPERPQILAGSQNLGIDHLG